MTKQGAIDKIENSFPSIWSKEDVLSLVNQIDSTEFEGFDKDKLLDKIKDAVDNAINGMSNDEIVDASECEFTIRNGNEIEIESIGVNTSNIIDEVMKEIAEVVEDYIEEEA